MERAFKALTYRMRGIPDGYNKIAARTVLLAALLVKDVFVGSLASDGPKQVATIRLPEKSSKLQAAQRDQLMIYAEGTSMRVDTHFNGFTSLHDPEGSSEDVFEYATCV